MKCAYLLQSVALEEQAELNLSLLKILSVIKIEGCLKFLSNVYGEH